MLTQLHVRGYKGLRDIDTSLEPLTVIVGPNGCGKTSALDAIALVGESITNSPIEPTFDEVHSKGESSAISIELRARVSQADQERMDKAVQESTSRRPTADPGRPSFLDLVPPDMFAGMPEASKPGKNELLVHLSHQPGGSRWDSNELVPWDLGLNGHVIASELFRRYFGNIRKLRFDAKEVAEPSYLSELVPRVSDNGGGLAAVLAALVGEQREKFEEIQDQLRIFVPELKHIRLRPARIPIVESQEVPVALDEEGKEVMAKRRYRREVIGNEILFDYRHAKGVRAKHASEGTLLLLGLLTVSISDKVSVLLLDDVDRALHPRAQQHLVAHLRKLTERGIQVIATTHSPYLVLHVEYEEVRLMTTSDKEESGALIGMLTDHPEYERWREDMTPSEFWTVFGEEWLAQARAKAEGHG